ncbi:hypothetical protein NDU88_008404 [Pleurodeles waltl]|uniref:Uncharacterized protein n=1 Tax=Pleurodeles waltl TaxID=8319 RepID=A0AAV7QRN8_PLEWA|nr:hypothetical protein NDU88_008404 [Pleurodeles waltl]
MLADIRRSLVVLAAPTKELPAQALPIIQGVAPGASTTTEQGQAALALPGESQDPTAQALLSTPHSVVKRGSDQAGEEDWTQQRNGVEGPLGEQLAGACGARAPESIESVRLALRPQQRAARELQASN